jgi:molybdopterin-guanine dinucleotide biosynthesis protein A
MLPTPRPHGVILAGGQATRMGGGDKPLRPLGHGVLLDHVIARIAPQVAALALSANGDPGRFAPWNLQVLPDATLNQGPLAGILAGLRWAAAAGAPYLLTAPGDAPFLPPDLAARLAAAAAPIAYAATPTQDHPTAALIATSLAENLESALAAGTRSLRAWMQPLGAVRVVWPVAADDPFLNVNTPKDLLTAEARLIRRRQPQPMASSARHGYHPTGGPAGP